MGEVGECSRAPTCAALGVSVTYGMGTSPYIGTPRPMYVGWCDPGTSSILAHLGNSENEGRDEEWTWERQEEAL